MANLTINSLGSQRLPHDIEDENVSRPKQTQKLLSETVTFIVENGGRVGITWLEVKEAYAKVIQEKCRSTTHDTKAALASMTE